MNECDLDQAMRSAGVLDHEVLAGGLADPAEFDCVAYAVGRQVLPPSVLREARAPLIEAILADGHAEPVEGEQDRFRWVGDPAAFDRERPRYRKTVQDRVQELLVRPGVASAAIGTMWGRRATIWTFGGTRLFAVAPEDPTRWHRDGWMMMGYGGPGDHVNIWIPLTRLEAGDGPLGIAVGSHRIPERPREKPAPYPLHLDSHLEGSPSEEVIAPLWRTSSFEVGDAVVFDPYAVHSTVPNDGPYLRLAIVLIAQDAAMSLPPVAGLSGDTTRELTDVEWLTLAILALQPSTRWLARCAFYSRGVIGRLWSKQPDNLVHDAFTILHGRELIEPDGPAGDPLGGIHTYFHATSSGHQLACEWLASSALTDPRLLAVRLQFCTWLNLDTTSLLSAASAGFAR